MLDPIDSGLRHLHRFATRQILYPLNTLHKGLSSAQLEEWRRLDNLGQDEIQEIQAANLRKLLVYADIYCPFYHQRFAEYHLNPNADNPFREIQKLPPLTKQDIRANINTLISTQFKGRRDLIKKATGGSTGVPLEVWGDQLDYQLNGLTIARQRAWLGWRGGMETISLFGGFRDLPSRMNRLCKSWLINDTIINNMARENGDYDRLAARILKHPPETLVAYFSSLCELARALEARCQHLSQVKLAIACAEPLNERARQRAEHWLGTRIYFQYGCRELGTFAQECTCQQGYHYAQDMALCEVLDDDSDPAEHGHLTITYFGNRVVPLIRYQVGDEASLDTSPCSCGLPYHRLKVIDGRTSAVLQTPTGQKLTALMFPHLFKDYPWILEYQVEQPYSNQLVLRIRRDKASFSESSQQQLGQKLLGLIGNDVALDWRYNEPFIQVPTGKHVYFISSLKN